MTDLSEVSNGKINHNNITAGLITTTTTTTLHILCMSFVLQKNHTLNPTTDAIMFKNSTLPERYSYGRGITERSSSFLGSALCCGPCFEGGFDDSSRIDINSYSNHHNLIYGDAFDIIIVQSENGDLYQNSDFLVSFTCNEKYDNHKIVLEIENGDANSDDETSKAWFPILRRGSCESSQGEDGSSDDSENNDFDSQRFWGCCHPESGSARPSKLSTLNASDPADVNTTTTSNPKSSESFHRRATVDDATNKLKPFLKRGRNPARYLLLDQLTVIGIAPVNIFLWKYDDSIIVSDIDGTITKSNARGAIDTIVTTKYQHVHHSICNLLFQLASQPKTHVVYITSRPLSLATSTRKFLDHVRQDEARLPEGPILGFGGKFSQLLLMELVSKTTHHFKSEIMWKQLVQPFRRANNMMDRRIFVAGLGNTVMDMQAYHAVGIELSRIYKINRRSEIVAFDRPINIASSIEITRLVINNSHDFNTTRSFLQFQTKKWFKERMGTVYSGYADPRLLTKILINPTKDLQAEDEEAILQHS